MRNHSLLYIASATSEPELLGASNSVFPSLWKILLANAAVMSPPVASSTLRASAVLVANADEAVQRAHLVCDVLLHEPIAHEVQGLSRYLVGVQQHLAATLEAWRVDRTSPLLMATFDEIARPEHMSLEEFGSQLQTAFAMDWQKLAWTIAAASPVAMLERLLASPLLNLRVGDWRAWSGVFGLALFVHPYFAGAFRAPLHGELADCDRSSESDANLDGGEHRWPFVNGAAAVMRNEYLGFVDANERAIGRIEFDQVDDFTPAGVARVRVGKRYGLLRLDGSFARPLECSLLEWSPESSRWHAVIEGKPELLLHPDGSCDAGDEHERALVPLGFAAAEALEPHREGRDVLARPDLLRVSRVTGNARPTVGVWSLERKALVVPCAYDFIWLTSFGAELGHGFIVGRKISQADVAKHGRFAVGVLDAEGIEIVPVRYAWLGARTSPSRRGAIDHVRGEVFHAWSRGLPVQGSPAPGGPLELIRPGSG